jgi:formiminoglutamase
LSAEEIHLRGIENSLEFLDQFSHHHESLFLSINMRVFAAPFVPGVGSPEPLGLYPWQVIPLLKNLVATDKLLGMGICGLADDPLTVRLAASLVMAYVNND